jgi:hypothetical protein
MARSWPSALPDDCFGLTLSVVRMAGGGADGNSAALPASCDGIDGFREDRREGGHHVSD